MVRMSGFVERRVEKELELDSTGWQIGSRMRVMRAWHVYLALGVVSAAAYFLPQTPFPNAVYGLIALSAAAIFVGVRRNAPGGPLGWRLIACGVISMAARDLVWYFYEGVLGEAPPYPSLADFFYLGGYPLIAAGLALMARARAPWRDDAGLLDATILAMGAGVLSWVFLIAPQIDGADGASTSLAGTAVTLADPLADVLLLGVVARLMLAGGARVPAYYLLVGGTSVMLASDVAYTAMALNGTSGGFIDAG